MEQLSAVIITYNEERDIGRCLDSLFEIADDIVVVDSGSTDQTAQICKKKGARFIKHNFEGYIEQKNYALTQAKYPLVLSLDADEALSDDLKASILEVKSNRRNDGYTMNRLNNYCGYWINYCGWYPDRKLRLWVAGKGRWGGVNPHDTFKMDPGTTIAHLEGDILHYSYYTREEHLEKIEKFSSIAAEALYKKGIKSNQFKIILHPSLRFIKGFFLKMGFMDGFPGWKICWYSAYSNYLKYKKLLTLQNAGSL